MSLGVSKKSHYCKNLLYFDFFHRSGHENVVDMMVARGAPISAKTKNGLAPLHMASQGDHVDAARILLHHKVIF